MLSSSLLGKTYYIWLQSTAFALLRSFYRAFSRAFKNSTIVHWFVRDSRIEPIYEASVFARVFKAILDFFYCIIAKVSAVLKKAAVGSCTAAFYRRFLKSSFFFSFETLLGGFICLMFIIPHDYWANPYALVASVGLFVLYFMLAGAGVRKRFYLHNMGLPFLLFAITCVFSIAFSLDRSDSIRIFMFYITAFLLLFVISADISNRQRLMRLLGFIYAAVIISALYAVYQRFTGVNVSASLTDLTINRGVPGRVFGTLGNPNNYAEFLVMMTPLAAVFAANVKKPLYRVGLCCGIALPMIALLMTYSRSCWLSMLLTCVVFVYFANKKLIPAFFLICVAAIPFLPESVHIRIASLFNSEDSSNMFRVYVWTGTVQMAKDNFFTGIGLGPGSFGVLYPEYAHPLAIKGVPHSHMVYLELIIELGIVGFLSFVWLQLRTIKDCACSALKSSNKTTKFALIACLSSLIGISFTFFVEYVWYYPRTFFAFFILLAVASAAIRMTRAEAEQTL